MPRRKRATKSILSFGERIRTLREERGLTLQQVGESDEAGNLKGHVSNIEHGRVNPTWLMLKKIAENLGIELPYLVTQPDASPRQALIERTRYMSEDEAQALLRELGPAPRAPLRPIRKTRRVAKRRVA